MDKPKQVIVDIDPAARHPLYRGGIAEAGCLEPGTYPCRVDGVRAILTVPGAPGNDAPPWVFVDTEHIYES